MFPEFMLELVVTLGIEVQLLLYFLEFELQSRARRGGGHILDTSPGPTVASRNSPFAAAWVG